MSDKGKTWGDNQPDTVVQMGLLWTWRPRGGVVSVSLGLIHVMSVYAISLRGQQKEDRIQMEMVAQVDWYNTSEGLGRKWRCSVDNWY